MKNWKVKLDSQEIYNIMIHLACTHGNFGFWNYYTTVIKIRDVVENNRIITVAESEELYTDNINRILQRPLDKKRINQISNYILKNDERFFSNIIVAIYGGTPKWTEMDISRTFEVAGQILDDDSIDFLSSKFGVLTLTGSEVLFALDGQHRVTGLRSAYNKNPEIGDFEVALTFVVHKSDQIEKTRRLFTVLNKYAEKPKGAELIIIDEDDVAAINTRKLVNTHPVLSIDKALSTSKTGNIASTDNSSFTTLVTINTINKILFAKPKAYFNTRPEESEINELYEKSLAFWNMFFELFPFIKNYIDDQEVPSSLKRDHQSGGSLLLRPVGQVLIAKAYMTFDSSNIEIFRQKIIQIDFNLSSKNWKYLYWTGDKMLGKNEVLKRNVILFLLGKFTNERIITKEMKSIYDDYNIEYTDRIEPIV